MNGREINVHITTGSLVKVALFGLLLTLLWFLRDIVLIVLSAVVIASSMEPGIVALMRHRFSRLLAVIAIYVGIVGVFLGLLFFILPPILTDAANFVQIIPTALSGLNLSNLTHGLIPATSNLGPDASAQLLRSFSFQLTDSSGSVLTTLSAFFGKLTAFVLIIVFAFYFSVQETGVDDFLRIITPARQQAYVLNLWKRSQDKIGKWMQGQLVLALIVGVLLYLGLLILDVQYALVLAVLAAVFELIPVFGQILAMVPAVAIGFTGGGVTEALLVAGLYLIVQQFEAHLIYPVVVKKVIGVPPILVILALLIGYKLVGFLGVLLSVPIAAAIKEYVTDLEKEKERLARALAAQEQSQ